MKEPSVSPCHRCCRVAAPELCDNLQCTLWRNWFLRQWEGMRFACKKQLEEPETVHLGVPLGGFYYAHPHIIRAYRRENPCKNCKITPLCTANCKRRSLWIQQGGLT